MERDDLELFIRANAASFNEGDLPDGHFERFQQRLQASTKASRSQEQQECGESKCHAALVKRRGLRWRRITGITSAAAAIVVLLTCGYLLLGTGRDSDEKIRVLSREHYTLIEKLSGEIVEEFGDGESKEYEISASLESILREGVPLENLLPEELSREQRMKILKEYYKERVNALLQFKTLLTQENNNIYE